MNKCISDWYKSKACSTVEFVTLHTITTAAVAKPHRDTNADKADTEFDEAHPGKPRKAAEVDAKQSLKGAASGKESRIRER